jgi:nucleotide-binding universal stress UspA family protein
MSTKRILVPVDFTDLSSEVTDQAIAISKKTGLGITLFHVLDKSSHPESTDELATKADFIQKSQGIECNSKTMEGSIFNVIPKESKEEDYALMIIGTHGIRGLKQKLLGADILKLISKVAVPAIVVQKDGPVIESMDRIILPAATHAAYDQLVKSVIFFATHYGSEVHLYTIERPGFEWPANLKQNIEATKKLFEDKGINLKRVSEPQTMLSVGFAKQTLQYAEQIHADMICMMSVPSEEYFYFAQQDKENMLMNEHLIPVLSTSNVEAL